MQGKSALRVTESHPARLVFWAYLAQQMDRVLLLNLSLSGATIESVDLTHKASWADARLGARWTAPTAPTWWHADYRW